MGPRWTHTLSLLTPGVLPITDLTVCSITVYVFITHVHVHFVLTCKKLQISYQKIQMATCFMSSGNTTKSQAHSPRGEAPSPPPPETVLNPMPIAEGGSDPSWDLKVHF